ncbi:small ribosomal subunit biogenesis GTPase RsgA [Halioxenophilus sp. WMMB6]|uniref:small ribosomal subunit biogenesis GTPase RsgA n=1 Tax=Halioxenophilus sp. WMMB6 TaxID=3073815 RepID=UPI00295E73E2|nr:small ribosomal subunit biogenesis GTPase RsgA [Halioxenophilus sp. WMMB6]
MAGRKLNRRQTWRVQKIQQERAKRAARKDEQTEQLFNDQELGPEQEGLVTAHFGTQVEVVAASDETRSERIRCHLRANLGSLVTGDRVVWRYHSGHGTGVVVAVLERTSELARPDASGNTKAIAANIDQIIIVFAPYPEPHNNLIDRYLVAAHALAIPALLLLNKQDRIDASNQAEINQLLAIYQRLDYPVLAVSTKTGQGIEALKQQLAGHTSIFVGQSGVGKSSLVNTLLPGVDARVGELSELTQKGTHTTTTAQLFHFPAGGDLIDSPGIREFGLWHMDEEEVFAGFKELAALHGQCKFRDCHHQQEPGCAVLNAAEAGQIQPQRLASYRHIINSLE